MAISITITKPPDAADIEKAPDVVMDPTHPVKTANAILKPPDAADILSLTT